MILLGLLIGFGISGIAFLVYTWKYHSLEADFGTKQKICDALDQRIEDLNQQKILLDNQVIDLQAQFNTLHQTCDQTQQMYSTNLKLINDKLDSAAEEIRQKYKNAIDSYKDNYLNTIADMSTEISTTIQKKQSELLEISKELQKAEQQQLATVQALMQQEKDKDKINFYKLNIPEEDLIEIKELRKVIVHLRNEEPLNKVIWKVYYEKPFTDLIGRLTSSQTACGIYKITNLISGKSYIGQSVNIKDRFRNHIKRGLGAENGSRNKLYTAMKKDGVENFTFEILELCERAELNDKERYWINFFKSQDYGYNETQGGG